MSTMSRALAAAATTLLALVIVAVLVARLAGAPIAQGPLASATAVPTATPPASVAPTPTLAPADELAALREIELQTRDLRGLPDPGIGAPDVITRAQLADEVQSMVDEGWTPDELQRAELTLEAMGLLQPGQDLLALTAQLLEGQVLGFYDFTKQRMVVVSDSGLTPEARVTYAHEYTHALQDGAFDAGAYLNGLTDDDAIGAYQALEEGDATLVMFQWALANLSLQELGQIGTTPQPDMTGIPDWMLNQLTWPYLAGLDFVTAISGFTLLPDAGGSGSWAPVNAAYTDPPASTEQVIHPDKYLSGELPLEVDPISVAGILGTGWQDLEPNTVGEAMISIWLTELGAGSTAEIASAGWGGDRQQVAVGPDGEWAMTWRIAFDTPADQDQFETALQLIRPGLVSYRHPSDTELILMTASSTDIALRLGDAIGPPAS